jgi:L-alanine-DL-glutamate epimerase-like enolase superfamily enzyme
MQLILHQFNLQLRHTFTITHESRDVQPTLIVELRDGKYSGFGEATETPYYGVTIQKMIAQLEAVKPIIENYKLENPKEFWQEISSYLLDSHPFALCALDCAAWDLWAKKRGEPLYKSWGLDISKNIITDYTIGIDSIEKMIEKMLEMPFPLYKIKLGTDNDIEIVKELRKHSDAVFRVDANTAWTAKQTIVYAPILKELGVEFIEQPLKADDWAGMKEVFAKSALPIIADESCILEADVEKCKGYFHGINIKLMKCGGLTPALRMIEKAKSLGLKTMVGCMTESTIGCSAIAHLLPLLDFVDMDGPLLVNDTISKGISIEYGKVIYANENGTGAQLI